MRLVKQSLIIILALFVISCGHLYSADTPATTPAKNVEDKSATKSETAKSDSDAKDDEDLPPALTEYKGREIAQTMHFKGAWWLTRDNRERQEECSTMLKSLGVKPGMVVCDMGCGNGFYSLQIAAMVGEKGKVLAVDIQSEMLRLLEARQKKETKLDNITTIHSSVIDPKLPKGKIDLILCVDVYHEFSHPEHMLAAMRESLAPGGRLVLVEFRKEDPKVPIQELHKMSKEQVLKELEPNGFKLVEQFDKLPWQHMFFFEVDKKEKAK